MKKNPLVDLLQRIAWSMPAGHRENVVIVIRHRGARNDEKNIGMADIARFDRGYIYVKKQEEEKGMDYDDEVPIPLHRVIRIIDAEGKTLYYKGNKKSDE